MRLSAPVAVLVFFLLAAAVLSPTAPESKGLLRIQATPTVLGSYSMAAFASLSAACDFAVRASPNGSVSYAYVVGTDLYYSWSGSTAPPVRLTSTAFCQGLYFSGIDLAFKPSGAVVVGWLDQRHAYDSARDGSLQGVLLYLASSDAGWSNVLAETSSTLRVTSFRVGVNSRGIIDVAYVRDTLPDFPYDGAVFTAASPTWAETNVSTVLPSTNLGVQGMDMALDSKDHVDVTWYDWGPPETVWYATSASKWSNVRVDTNQSTNPWDNRYDPAIAVDSSDAAHIVWVDGRTENWSSPNQSNNASLYTASSATGFVNEPLVFPGSSQYLREPFHPSVAIDAAGAMHVTWLANGDYSNLYYANSTDWNLAYRITDEDGLNNYGSIFPLRPVVVLNSAVSLFFADTRTGFFVVWKKTAWGTVDTTSPVVEPRSNLTLGVNLSADLRATGTWDDDRIVSWQWSASGPASFSLSGYDISATFPLPGVYRVTLSVADPAGFTAYGSFNVTALPSTFELHWEHGKVLYAAPENGGVLTFQPLVMSPWRGSFAITDTWASNYATVSANGTPLSGPALFAGPMDALTTDPSGNIYMAGFNGFTGQLDFTSLSPAGATVVSPTALALGGISPQQPSLAFANGRVWLAWSDQRNNLIEIYLAALNTSGAVTWGPARVSLTNDTVWSPRVALSGDRLWIVYTPTNSPARAAVFNLTTMAFEFQDLSLGIGNPGSVGASPGGGIAVVWPANPGLYVSRFNATGVAAGPRALVNFDDGALYGYPDLMVDSAGTAHVVWWAEANWSLWYTQVLPNGTVTPRGGVLVAPSVATAPSGFESASVQLGPDGLPRIAYTTGDGSGTQVAFAYYDSVPPVARMVHDSVVRENHPAMFSGLASSDNDGMGTYHWDFGDGTTADGPTVDHSFSDAGVFPVNLTVRDAAGNPNWTVDHVVANLAPTAVITVRPNAALTDQPIVLDASDSTEVGGSVSTYEWSIGGGNPANYTGAVVTVRIHDPGPHMISLTVTDSAGTSDHAEAPVTIWPSPTFVVVSEPSGFQIPVPDTWQSYVDRQTGGETIPILALGPVVGNFQTNVLVSYSDDPTAQETQSYLASGVDAIVQSVRQNSTDANLSGEPTFLTVSGHAAVAFSIVYPSRGVLQRVVIVVSAAHKRDWILLLSVAASAYDQTNATFAVMVAGFAITSLPPYLLTIITIGLIAGTVAAAAFFVVRVRKNRATRNKVPQILAPDRSHATTALFCVNCGRAMAPEEHFCGMCGTPAWTGAFPAKGPPDGGDGQAPRPPFS